MANLLVPEFISSHYGQQKGVVWLCVTDHS